MFNVLESHGFCIFCLIISLVALGGGAYPVPATLSWMEMEVSEMSIKNTFIIFYLKFRSVL